MLLLAMVNGLVAILGPATGRVSDLFGWVAGAQAVVLAVLAIFLFRGATWARFTVIAFILLGLALVAYDLISTGSWPGCLPLLPQIIILVLMLQRPVADWCNPHLREAAGPPRLP
jgi:hypothetical protein